MVFFLLWRNRHSALIVLWVCQDAQAKAKFGRIVVCVIRVDVLVHGIVSHGRTLVGSTLSLADRNQRP